MGKTLALFDFDGTITTKDSFLELIKFSKGTNAFIKGMLLQLPFIVTYKIGLISAQTLKEKVIKFFWKDTSEKKFRELCIAFNTHCLQKILRPQAIETLHTHLSKQDDVAVVTASAEDWVEIFCSTLPVKCIGTKLEKKNSKLTGNILGKNCKDAEKLKRVKEIYDLNSYDNIIVYGDSSGDKQLFEVATKVMYKPFRN